MKLKLRAILYALFIAMLPVGAAECSTLEKVKEDVKSWSTPTALVEMDKKATEAFLEIYNAMPPPSEEQGDYSVVIGNPESPRIVYVYFLNNCAIRTLFMERELFETMLKATLPEPKGQKA